MATPPSAPICSFVLGRSRASRKPSSINAAYLSAGRVRASDYQKYLGEKKSHHQIFVYFVTKPSMHSSQPPLCPVHIIDGVQKTRRRYNLSLTRGCSPPSLLFFSPSSSATIFIISVFTASLFFAVVESTPFFFLIVFFPPADGEASLQILLKPANAAAGGGDEADFPLRRNEEDAFFFFFCQQNKGCKRCVELCAGTEL